MKKLIVSVLLIVLSLNAFAENNDKITEVGIMSSSLLSSYRPIIKFGNENSLYRVRTFYVDNDFQEDQSVYPDDIIYTSANKQFGIGLAFGKEKRKTLMDNFELRYGVDLSFAYSSSVYSYEQDTVATDTRYTKTISPGMNIVLGVQYILKDHFVFGVEILPSLSYRMYRYTYEDERSDGTVRYNYRSTNNFSFDISSLAMFTVSYRF